MHDYLFPIEVGRFAFVAGVVVSVLLYERRHLTTGSIVVPGYIALFALMPSVLVATTFNAFLTYVIVNKVLPRWVLLYGKTKFMTLAIISSLLQVALLKLSPAGPWLWEANIPYFVGVGYIVPGLIAHDMGRQGVRKTVKSVLLAGAIVSLPIVLSVLAGVPNDVTRLAPFGSLSDTHIVATWIPLAILLSVAGSWAVAVNYGLRAGGFVGAALLAIFAGPWRLPLIVGIALLTHWLVTQLLMRHMILFGRRKFAAMLLISSIIVWTAIWIGGGLVHDLPKMGLGVGTLALTPLFLPGLIANDMQRATIGRVVTGTVLNTLFVLATTTSAHDLVVRGRVPIVTAVAAVVTTAIVFGPQFAASARWAGRAVAARTRRLIPTMPRLRRTAVAPAAPDVAIAAVAAAAAAAIRQTPIPTTPAAVVAAAVQQAHPDRVRDDSGTGDDVTAPERPARPAPAARGRHFKAPVDEPTPWHRLPAEQVRSLRAPRARSRQHRLAQLYGTPARRSHPEPRLPSRSASERPRHLAPDQDA